MAEPANGGPDLAPTRELSADLYRVVAVVIVVVGHWLISAVTFRDGAFGNEYPLAIFPWAQWLTLVFQVVPVFFLVGGYASATAWMRWQEVGGQRWPDWVRQRVGALLGPDDRIRRVGAGDDRGARQGGRRALHRCPSEAGRSPCICGSYPCTSSWWR